MEISERRSASLFVTWYTSEDDIGKQVNSPQDLQEIVKNISSLEGKIITQGERYYVLAGGAAYWMHENKYLICASNWLNYHSDEELLLAEDITFEKYKIK